MFWRSYVCVFAHVCLFKCYARLTSRHACMLNDVNLFSFQKKKETPYCFLSTWRFFFFWLHWCCLYPFFSTTWDVQKKDQLCFSFSYRRLLLTTLWTARRCKFVCVLSLLHLLFPFITFWEALHNFTRNEKWLVTFFSLLFSLPPPMPVYSHTFLFPFFYLLYMKEFMPRLLIYL